MIGSSEVTACLRACLRHANLGFGICYEKKKSFFSSRTPAGFTIAKRLDQMGLLRPIIFTTRTHYRASLRYRLQDLPLLLREGSGVVCSVLAAAATFTTTHQNTTSQSIKNKTLHLPTPPHIALHTHSLSIHQLYILVVV